MGRNQVVSTNIFIVLPCCFNLSPRQEVNHKGLNNDLNDRDADDDDPNDDPNDGDANCNCTQWRPH